MLIILTMLGDHQINDAHGRTSNRIAMQLSQIRILLHLRNYQNMTYYAAADGGKPFVEHQSKIRQI